METTVLSSKNLIAMLNAVSDRLLEEQEHLNRLDAELGDGDHGTGISKAFSSAVEAIQGLHMPAEILQVAATTLMNRMGGSSGALYGTLFLRAGLAVSDQQTLAPSDFAAMWQAGAIGVQQRGKAERGDKTMLDALLPAVDAMQNKMDYGTLLEAAADAAQNGAQESAKFVAKHGRAKFLGERAVGHIDAGAASTAIMFVAMHNYWKGLEHGKS